MITEDTIHKSMKLHTMAKTFRELLVVAPSHDLTFEEKLGMIVDREWTDRDNRRLARRLKEARLAVDASLEDAVCDAGRGLDKSTVRQLATCAWVRAKQNVIVVGATGVGNPLRHSSCPLHRLAQASAESIFQGGVARQRSADVQRSVQGEDGSTHGRSGASDGSESLEGSRSMSNELVQVAA